MEKAIFSVHFESDKTELTESGQDSVVFYMSTNPGEPLKPLAKIASGGELSRMMLALKTIFQDIKALHLSFLMKWIRV